MKGSNYLPSRVVVTELNQALGPSIRLHQLFKTDKGCLCLDNPRILIRKEFSRQLKASTTKW